MIPFKPFLSPNTPFRWSVDLESAFQASKSSIIEAIRHGVEIFDIRSRTCLRSDWSKNGNGYFHCDCATTLPGCCDDGWTISLAGSRFLTPTEQRYVPKVAHLPGKTNTAADATSRDPSQSGYAELTSLTICSGMDFAECAIIAAIRRDSSSFTALS